MIELDAQRTIREMSDKHLRELVEYSSGEPREWARVELQRRRRERDREAAAPQRGEE